jgi:NTP pyrophosphatase (non-canonical NTP hydrolase)
MIDNILQGQKDFQKMVGFPIDSILDHDRNELSEKYIFKLIEEAIELRKEFPSVINPWSKSQKVADLSRVKEELSDIILFIINFMNVWNFTPEEIGEQLIKTQKQNFQLVKEKKMNLLNQQMKRVPGIEVECGCGNLTPKYVYITQRPALVSTMEPILKKQKVDVDDCYYTSQIKVNTETMTDELISFWKEFLDKELEILKFNNPNIKIIQQQEHEA